jgi:hypothetical protein
VTPRKRLKRKKELIMRHVMVSPPWEESSTRDSVSVTECFAAMANTEELMDS